MRMARWAFGSLALSATLSPFSASAQAPLNSPASSTPESSMPQLLPPSPRATPTALSTNPIPMPSGNSPIPNASDPPAPVPGQANALTAGNPMFQTPVNPPVLSPAASSAVSAPAAPPFDWSKFTLGGQYRIEADANNFGYHPLLISNSQKDSAFVDQRFRLWLTYNPTENVEGYIQMQVGGINWGSGYDFSKTFSAPYSTTPDDQVGVLLRRAWLAYKDEDLGKFRAGILDWHDSFNDTMASSDYDFNVGGVDWVKTFQYWNNLKVQAAILMLSDQALVPLSGVTNPGSHTAVLVAFDVDQPIMEKSSIGFSTYYLNDHGGYSYPTVANYQSSYDIWIGARGKTVLPWLLENGIPMDGFVISNFGDRKDADFTTFRHNGWASMFEIGPIECGPGKFSTQLLYSSGDGTPGSGDSHEFRTLAQTARDNFGAQGYWSYLNLTSPSGPNDVADLGVSLQNQGYGLFTLQAKYEWELTKKLTSTTTVGWLRSDRPNEANGSTNMGTEVGQMFTYKFGGGLTLDIGQAVLFTGNFYREAPQSAAFISTTPSINGPAVLWESFARLQLEF